MNLMKKEDNIQEKNNLLSKKILVKVNEIEINKNLNSNLNDLKKENEFKTTK